MLRIRNINVTDRGKIYNIIQNDEIFTSGEIELFLFRMDIFLFEKEQKLFKVIIVEDKIKEVQGYAVFGTDPATVGMFQIYKIASSPLANQKGVFERLLIYIEKQIKKRNGRIIIVEISSHTRYRSHFKFYLNNNYIVISKITDFYAQGEHKLILSKYLYNVETKIV